MPPPPPPPTAPRPLTAAELEIARWRQRVHEALRLLDVDATTSDPQTRADALWLARVLPDSEGQATATIVAGSATSKRQVTASRPRSSQAATGVGAQGGATPPAVQAPVPSNPIDLFVPQPAVDGEPGLAARRLLVPAADALPGRPAIERALRPLLRRRPSSQRLFLDTEATALASARASADLLAAAPPGTRAQALVPVLQPMRERWFDVALLAEQDPGMLPFEDTLHALHDLMARHGAFGRVRLWRWSVQGDKVTVRTPSGQPAGRRAMVQVQRPQIVLVFTHGVSAHWGRLPLREFMHELGRQAVLGVVQVLPSPAWGFTALGAADERVRNRERGGPNRLLQRLDPWSGLWRNRAGLSAVPVLELEANSLARWARWVMAPRLLEHAAAAIGGPISPLPPPGSGPQAVLAATQVVPLAPPPPPLSPRPPPSPSPPSDPIEAEAAVRKRVLQFRAIASPQAFALLRLLAAAWITLPVMRLLLASLPGPASAAPLAEVLLSGLLRRTPPAPDAQPTDPLVFEFEPGVRDWLHGSLSREERAIAERTMAASREQIRRFVEQVTKTRIESFAALLLDPSGDERLPASARSFVEVSRRLRALRGAGRLTDATLTGNQPTGPGPRPGSAALGALHGFPPQLRELVGRPALEASLRSMLLALREGATLALTARPGAGARTLLSELLRERSVRERYPGGIWFGTEPPPRSNGDPAGARLAVRLGGKARGGDASVELRWYREGEVHIDLLSTEEVNAYLGRQNISSVQLRIGQERVHRGVPSLIGVFSVGTRLGTTQWPRTSGAQPERNWAVITQRMLSNLPDSLRATLIRMAVRRSGYFRPDESGAELAMQLGWRVVDPGAVGGTLAPSIGKALETWYPNETAAAHAALLHDLMIGPVDESHAQYASRHLIVHAAGTGGRDGVMRVLADRGLLSIALKGGTDGLISQLEARAKRNKVLGAVRDELLSDSSTDVPLVDRARAPLMPNTGKVLRDWLGAGSVPGADGRGIRVALLSTGVDATHPELQHVPITGATTDPDGHGTGVASLIAGRFAGVAPGVSLQSLAPIGGTGKWDSSAIPKALDQILALPDDQRAHVVCLAFGMSLPDRSIAEALMRVVAAGIVVVAAGGSDGSEHGLSFPASMAEVLGVGALDAHGAPAVFSNRDGGRAGYGPELWAPGTGLLVALPPGSSPPAKRWPARYQTQDGTSHACAVVAALAALYAQVTGRRGSALRELLLQTALDGKARFQALLEPQGRDEAGQGDSHTSDDVANLDGDSGSVAVPDVAPEEDAREALHAWPSNERAHIAAPGAGVPRVVLIAPLQRPDVFGPLAAGITRAGYEPVAGNRYMGRQKAGAALDALLRGARFVVVDVSIPDGWIEALFRALVALPDLPVVPVLRGAQQPSGAWLSRAGGHKVSPLVRFEHATELERRAARDIVAQAERFGERRIAYLSAETVDEEFRSEATRVLLRFGYFIVSVEDDPAGKLLKEVSRAEVVVVLVGPQTMRVPGRDNISGSSRQDLECRQADELGKKLLVFAQQLTSATVRPAWLNDFRHGRKVQQFGSVQELTAELGVALSDINSPQPASDTGRDQWVAVGPQWVRFGVPVSADARAATAGSLLLATLEADKANAIDPRTNWFELCVKALQDLSWSIHEPVRYRSLIHDLPQSLHDKVVQIAALRRPAMVPGLRGMYTQLPSDDPAVELFRSSCQYRRGVRFVLADVTVERDEVSIWATFCDLFGRGEKLEMMQLGDVSLRIGRVKLEDMREAIAKRVPSHSSSMISIAGQLKQR